MGIVDRHSMLVGLGGMVASAAVGGERGYAMPGSTRRRELEQATFSSTMASSVAAALGVSIPYTQRLGVENIQHHRQRSLDALA